MRIVKKILIFLAVLGALILVVALFVKKDFASEKEVVVNKPKQDVFNYIKQLKNQNDYGVWAKKDPNIKQVFTGTDGTEGFVSSWEGNSEVGKGSQTIKKITDGQRIDLDLHFIEPWDSHSPAWLTTEEVSPTQTKVKWGMSGKMTYPFNIMCLFMNMNEMIGKDLQTGLDNMKGILEK
ncbi:MAG: SRPBCC family protein [Bacteroidota bacterium]